MVVKVVTGSYFSHAGVGSISYFSEAGASAERGASQKTRGTNLIISLHARRYASVAGLQKQ